MQGKDRSDAQANFDFYHFRLHTGAFAYDIYSCNRDNPSKDVYAENLWNVKPIIIRGSCIDAELLSMQLTCIQRHKLRKEDSVMTMNYGLIAGAAAIAAGNASYIFI